MVGRLHLVVVAAHPAGSAAAPRVALMTLLAALPMAHILLFALASSRILLAAPGFTGRVSVTALSPLALAAHILLALSASLFSIRHKLHTSLEFRDKSSRRRTIAMIMPTCRSFTGGLGLLPA
jgi:hypothetical protein